MVKQVPSDAEFGAELSSAGGRLVVVDFFATWCGPCHAIAPFVEELAKKFPAVVFLKVDVDVCQETAMSQGVQAMPTFNFYMNSVKVDSLRGANPAALEAKVAQLAPSAEAFPPAGGRTLGGSGGAPAQMNQELLSNLLDMGFADFKAKKALEATNNAGLEEAMDWLIAHQDDLELSEATAASVAEPAAAQG